MVVPVGGSYIKPPKRCLDKVVPQHFLHRQAGDLWWKLQRGKQTLWRGYRVLELKVHQTTYQEPWTTLADTGVWHKSGRCSKRTMSQHFWSSPKRLDTCRRKWGKDFRAIFSFKVTNLALANSVLLKSKKERMMQNTGKLRKITCFSLPKSESFNKLFFTKTKVPDARPDECSKA